MSFSYVAPHMWNKLPDAIRQSPSLATFKSRLKTHLFNEAFNLWDIFIYFFYYYSFLFCIYCKAPWTLERALYKICMIIIILSNTRTKETLDGVGSKVWCFIKHVSTRSNTMQHVAWPAIKHGGQTIKCWLTQYAWPFNICCLTGSLRIQVQLQTESKTFRVIKACQC